MKTLHKITISLMLFALCSIGLPAFAENGFYAPEEEYYFDEDISFSDEELQEALTWIEQHVPSWTADLEALKQEMPEEYEMELFHAAEAVEYFRYLQQKRPDLFEEAIKAVELELRTGRLAEEIAETNDADLKAQKTGELKALLDEIFEIRLKERMVEIEELEAEITEMKVMIEHRRVLKEKVIDRHLEELLSIEDEFILEWW